jgi:hypothetical protein
VLPNRGRPRVALRPYAESVIVFYRSATRHRWWFLLGIVLVTAALGTAAQTIVSVWAGLLLLAGTLLLCVVLMLGFYRTSAELLIERGPGAFEIVDVVHRTLLLAGAFTVFWGTLTFAERIGDLARGDRAWLGEPLRAVPAVLMLGFMVYLWYLALSRPVVRLDAGGILVRGPHGSKTVPWAGLTEEGVTPNARTSTVRLSPSGVKVPTSDPEYLAWILRQYLADPSRREAIGSETELGRILR